MASFAAIRSAVAEALDSISLLRTTAYITDSVSPPAGGGWAMVEFDTLDYDLTFGRGSDEIPVLVLVFAPREQAEASQRFLDTLRDPTTGIKSVLEDDANILALVDYIRVRSCDRPQIAVVGNVEYIVAEFHCEVVQ